MAHAAADPSHASSASGTAFEEEFKLRPFSLQKFGDRAFALFTIKGGHLFDDQRLYDLLLTLQSNWNTPLSKCKIITLLKHPEISGDALFTELQKEAGLFQRATTQHYAPRGVAFVSDYSEASEDIVCALQEEISIPVRPVRPNEPYSASEHLIVGYFEKYRPSLVRSIYAQYGNPAQKNLLLTAYVDRRDLLIDGLYSPLHGTPCHFCRRGWLEEDFRDHDVLKADRWTALMSRLKEQQEDASSSLPISALERGLALFHVHRVARNLLSPFSPIQSHDIIVMGSKINLGTGDVRVGPVSHHPACTCLNL